MKNNSKGGNAKKIIIAVICFALVFTLAVVGIHIWEKNLGTFKGEHTDSQENDSTLNFQGVNYVFRDDVETVLVMGLDKYLDGNSDESYNNKQQADFMMLLVFDKAQKSYTALHLNRDTMVEMPILGVTGEEIGTAEGQIALSHTYGTGGKDSCVNVRKTVSSFLLDAKIDAYMSLTMDAVKVINDAVGGVTVTIEDDFSGIDDTLVLGESVTLKGEHALNFVRTRMGLDDSSNERRMKRQQQYLSALKEKVAEFEKDKDFATDVLSQVNDYLVSDCSVTRLDSIFDRTNEYEFTGVYTLDGEIVVTEHKEFYADGESVLKTVTSLFCEPIEE